MMEDDLLLQEVEKRISMMEEQVVPRTGNEKEIMNVLMEANTGLNNFATKRERFNQIFKRVPAILEYLSPGFIDTVAMGNDYEREFVLSSEEEIVTMSKQFEEIQKLSSNLDSEKIREVPSHQSRLNKLELVQQTQLDDLSAVSSDLNSLLLKYNELVSALSENFVKWDWVISKLEEGKNSGE
ncbi:dynactin subunit 3-like [Clavelina lepadiformis]|uniref:dynactin subunit 3-like n=1 Tax=Clavelina lepadiformis TaxID=159417 RepID=UPI0040419BA2